MEQIHWGFSCLTKEKKRKVFDFRFQTIVSELKQMQFSCKIKKKVDEVIIGRRVSVASHNKHIFPNNLTEVKKKHRKKTLR